MSDFIIGIIDDDKTHVTDIKRIFKRYAKLNSFTVDFEIFYDDEEKTYDNICKLILSSIEAETIDCLIIDYKLIMY